MEQKTTVIHSFKKKTTSAKGKLDAEKGGFIMFDIETTGLSRDSDIVQLSAFNGITEFTKSANQKKNANAISGITF